jgi:hypothetical protein
MVEMQLSKTARLAAIASPAVLGSAGLFVWYDMNTPPSLSEYIESTKNAQEVKSFIAKYPNAEAVEHEYFYDCDYSPCPPRPLSIDYSYAIMSAYLHFLAGCLTC